MPQRDQITSQLCQRIVENLAVATLVFDRDLRLRYINPAGEMLFAVSARHLKGSLTANLFNGPNRLTELLQTVRDEAHPITEREIELNFSPSKSATVDVTITPLPDARGDPIYLVELHAVDRKLRILRDEQLMNQQSATHAILRGLAHEINNPLGGLRGAAQLLERALADEELKEYTQVIIGEADRLQNLLSRLIGPKNLPRKSRVNIHELVERVRKLVAAEAPAGIFIQRDYDPSIPELWIDPDLIIQAILNIVRNAVQALGTHGTIILRTRARRQFNIGARRHRLVIALEIIDNGPGIPPDIAEKIFFPMVTGRAEGTGLGLAIAQSLVNQHEGLIEFQSQPGQTVFTLLLPLDNDHGD